MVGQGRALPEGGGTEEVADGDGGKLDRPAGGRGLPVAGRAAACGWRRCCRRASPCWWPLLVLYPLGMVVFGTFWSAAPGQPGTLTLENWRSVLGDPATFEVLLTSLAIAIPRTVLALVLATVFAWCIARTNTPAKRLLEGLLVFMFFLPELPWVLAWMLLGAPNVGLLNQWLGALVPGGEGLIDVYSYGGLIVLGAARSAPVLFLFVHPAFLAMDATLEEAARMAGASALAHPVAYQLPAAAAGPAGVGHPVVRGGDGILRDPAAARHARQHLRVHDPDLRPGLRRPCRQLRRRHGAGADPARADRQPDRGAVAAAARPGLHHRVGPRLQGPAARPGCRAMDRLRRHPGLLHRLRCPAVGRAAVELVHGAERLHLPGDVHHPALGQCAWARRGAEIDHGHAHGRRRRGHPRRRRLAARLLRRDAHRPGEGARRST